MYAISRSHTVWYIGCAMAAPKYTRDRATTMPGNAYTAKPRVFTVRLINPGYRTNRAATGIEHVTVVIAASIETKMEFREAVQRMRRGSPTDTPRMSQ
jgi:hypothetical protein